MVKKGEKVSAVGMQHALAALADVVGDSQPLSLGLVFLIVAAEKRTTVSHVRTVTGLPKSTLARHVDALGAERRTWDGDLRPGYGLIDHHPDLADRRRHVLRLSRDGEALLLRMQRATGGMT